MAAAVVATKKKSRISSKRLARTETLRARRAQSGRNWAALGQAEGDARATASSSAATAAAAEAIGAEKEKKRRAFGGELGN